ncbi:class I SAM-dependent methyltransferase [Pseudonocardia kunmingensis]|uniref:Ubiquinone/menaquinone biosynthesis C-methylase UbiE n=1 Tax=Pseudonocardia kunmingensis TaxID=630975 RepID=A0A543E3B1_9PSEU|nr:class I SAM-dependent methyltransferase [Pseudonocardia kunmingensis]TQM16078.1 ubiquinone/menaquinone biosynthesis C-methylase UbiE [Pseudonocardia kunmingensis]
MLRPPVRDIHAYYAEHFVEDDRLHATAHGRLEYERTQELLRRYLPTPPARVLDVGGATGVHARRLAADGYVVHVVDLVPEHVAVAAALPGVTAAVGDARQLAEPDAHADATLLLGPLYHLVDRADRVRALREAARATVPGGLVAAAAISRHAPLLEMGARDQIDDATGPVLRQILATGRHDPRLGFTTAYLHRVDELTAEMHEAGLREVRVHGVEGPLASVVLALEPGTERFPAALCAARLADEDEDQALAAASLHLLGVART